MFEGEIFIEREKTLAGMYFQREHDWYAQLIRCSLYEIQYILQNIFLRIWNGIDANPRNGFSSD